MKHKDKLNDNQLHLLKLIYKFRFVDARLLSSYRKVNISAVNRSLAVLVSKKLVGRKYQKDFRIKGIGATYYLLPDSLKILKEKYLLNDKALHANYKNSRLSQSFVNHSLDIFKHYITLKNNHTEAFNLFTKAELQDFDFFPEPYPDLYLRRTKESDDQINEYILDILPDNQLFVLKKRILSIFDHFDSGEWEAGADSEYPAILLICSGSAIESRIQVLIAKILENSGIDDELTFLTTTSKALLNSTNSNRLIWSNVLSPEKLVHL